MGLIRCEREISEEVYNRAILNRGFITADDKAAVFTISELCGYGVYCERILERDRKYFVAYERGSSCD